MTQKTSIPITTLCSIPRNERCLGTPREYCSEADYWWPGPGGVYERLDGQKNPDAYHAHRAALHSMARDIPKLVLSGDYETAGKILNAWFVDPETAMVPHLKYGQGIPGRCEGRCQGIVDTLPLVEVTRSAEIAGIDIKPWFREYLKWITTNPLGLFASCEPNNHATSYWLQVAEFSRYVGDQGAFQKCVTTFPKLLDQVAPNGSFPAELERTRSFTYSLMQLDLISALAEILGSWSVTLEDGRCLSQAFGFMIPAIKDKTKWQRPDIILWDELPVRQTFLLLASRALGRSDYADLWEALPRTDNPELLRNFPLQHEKLWLSRLP